MTKEKQLSGNEKMLSYTPSSDINKNYIQQQTTFQMRHFNLTLKDSENGYY